MSWGDDVRDRPRLPASHAEVLGKLRQLIAQASADEARVLLLTAERLHVGRQRYGELHLGTDKRDFAREALEEVLDSNLYAAMGLLQRR